MLNKPMITIEQENGKIDIYGNNQPSELLYWHELTDNEQKDFLDCMSQDTAESETYFRYKGNVHCLGDFMRIDSNAPFYGYGFDGYSSDSFFSGLLVKLCQDNEYVKVYTYIS